MIGSNIYENEAKLGGGGGLHIAGTAALTNGGGRVGTSRRACNEWRIQAGHPNDSGAPPQSPFKVEAISTATNVEAHVRTVFALSVEPEGQRRLDYNP